MLSDEEAALLQVGSPEEVAILLLVYRDETEALALPSGEPVKANIHGPLLLNVRQRLILQKLLLRLDQTILLRAPEED